MVFHRLTKENENATTELLANLMQRKYFRDAVIRFLLTPRGKRECYISQTVIDEIDGKAVSTQVKSQEQGQPDLVVYSPNVFLVLENKTRPDTVLQKHEVDDYIKLANRCLTNNYLVFLVPSNYKYLNLIESINGGPVTVLIHFWEDFLVFIESLEIESPIVSEAILYLKGFFKPQKDYNFTAKEIVAMFKTDDYFIFKGFQKKFSERIKKIKELVLKELNTESNKQRYGVFVNTGGQDDEFAIGEYICLGKNGSIFFGLSNPKDFEDKNYAYSVCFWTEYFNCEELQRYPFVKDGKWGWRCVPFFDDDYSEGDFVNSENDSVLASRIVRIIINMCESMNNN